MFLMVNDVEHVCLPYSELWENAYSTILFISNLCYLVHMFLVIKKMYYFKMMCICMRVYLGGSMCT